MLKIDAEPALFSVCKRGADRGRIVVADRHGAGLTDVLMVLFEIPEALSPTAHCIAARNQSPVFVLDLRPQLGRNPGGADWTVIPSVSGPQAILLHSLLACCGNFGSASVEESFAISGHEAL